MAVYAAKGASSINLGALAPHHKHTLSQVSGLTLRALTLSEPAMNEGVDLGALLLAILFVIGFLGFGHKPQNPRR